MHKTFLLFVIICIHSLAFGQEKDEQTKKLNEIKTKVDSESDIFKKELDKRQYLSDFEKKITIDFTIDTFKIERSYTERIALYYSTTDLCLAISDANGEYDKLLNKYYQLLLAKLKETDKLVLKQTQRNWIQFRDSEEKLNSLLTQDEYSGGGTIQRIVYASDQLEFTKRRVIDLFNYLLRFYE